MAAPSVRPASGGTATPPPETLSTIGVLSEMVWPADGLVLTTSPLAMRKLATGDWLAVTLPQPSLFSLAVAAATLIFETSGSVCLPGRTL